jgi:glycosyltransferase involved in cell wall biosynthesis
MPRRQGHIDDRMRVLFLNTKRLPPLGADTWVHLQIIRELDRSRVDVHVACVRGEAGCPTPTYERLREIPDVTVVNANLGREMASRSPKARAMAALSLIPAAWSVLRLAWYVRRRGIDVIHSADRPRDAAVALFLSRVTPAKCVVHAHVGFDASWMRPSLQRAIRRADARIAISEYVAGTLRDAGCDAESTYVVLNGIEPACWHPLRGRDTIRRELAIADATPVVLTVCRLFRAKGVSELVKALHDVTDDVPSAVLLVVGEPTEPNYLEELREMVRAYDLDDRVRFLGRRDDVPTLMAGADVFAMPSRYEPFGLVFAEAMAMTLPVLGLSNGGTVEIVEQGVTGLLSAPGDGEALAANLRQFLLEPDRRAAYGKRGRERVERLFTTRRMADDTADVFAKLLSRGAVGAGGSGSVEA